VVAEAFALDELLGHGVAGCEEDGGCDGLGEERARGQLGLVPDMALGQVLFMRSMGWGFRYQRNMMAVAVQETLMLVVWDLDNANYGVSHSNVS